MNGSCCIKRNITVCNYDFVFSYQYSRDSDRMWRKTRSPIGSIFGCKGVDPNRNWGYHWGESGVSNDKCSDIYPGPEAFSEIEMQNIKNFVESLTPTPILGKLRIWQIKAYFQIKTVLCDKSYGWSISSNQTINRSSLITLGLNFHNPLSYTQRKSKKSILTIWHFQCLDDQTESYA